MSKQIFYKEYFNLINNNTNINKSLSETWKKTLLNRKKNFSISEFESMRSPGNPVTARFIDTTYSLHSDFFLKKNKIFNEILKLKEPEYGKPYKDIILDGKSFSSIYLKEANYASIIIKNILNKKIKKPIVLEIGAGIGLLSLILKKYFKKKIKIILIDVPEILALQKIYLKNIFLNNYTFSNKILDNFKSDFTFLNNLNYQKKSFKFDVAINFDSMNLIEKKNINKYFRFIQDNISENGLFIFSNRHGVSNKSYKNIYDYPFDSFWKIKKFHYDQPYLTCSEASHYFVIFERRKKNKVIDKSFISTLVNNSQNNIFNNHETYKNFMLKNLKFFKKEKTYNREYKNFYPYIDNLLQKENNSLNNTLNDNNFFELVESYIKLIKNEYLLRLKYNKPIDKNNIQDFSKKIYYLFEKKKRFNPYYFIKLYLIFSIEKNHIFKKKIFNSFLKKSNNRWKLRFIKILDLANEEKKINILLEKIKILKKDNYNYLNYAFYMNKKTFETNIKHFKKILSSNSNDLGILFIIMKLSLKNLNYELLSTTLRITKNRLDGIQGEPIFELSEILNKYTRSKKIKKIFCQKYIYKIIDNSNYKKLKKNFIRAFVDNKLFGKRLKISMFKEISKIKDYYELTWFGKNIINSSYKGIGKKILIKSVSLRKNEIHNEFIANILIKKNFYMKAFKILEQSKQKRFYDKNFVLLYYLSQKKININNIKYRLIMNLFSDSDSFYYDLPNWR